MSDDNSAPYPWHPNVRFNTAMRVLPQIIQVKGRLKGYVTTMEYREAVKEAYEVADMALEESK